jgi:hypothetical protein
MSHLGDSLAVKVSARRRNAGSAPVMICFLKSSRKMYDATAPLKMPNAVQICQEQRNGPRFGAARNSLSQVGTTAASNKFSIRSCKLSTAHLLRPAQSDESLAKG